jgi:hypothetical protein
MLLKLGFERSPVASAIWCTPGLAAAICADVLIDFVIFISSMLASIPTPARM